MKIKKLIVKNYRNLKDVTIDFSDLTILIGKNNAGKSNILKALDLFFNWEESEDYKEIAYDGGKIDIRVITKIKDYRIFLNQKPETIELTGILELNNAEINELFPDRLMNFHKSQSLLRDDIGNLVTISKQIIGKDKKAIWTIDSIKMSNLLLYSYSEGGKQLQRNDNGIYTYNGGGTSIYDLILTMLRKNFIKIPAVREIKEENRVGNPPSADGQFVANTLFKYKNDKSLGKKPIYKKIQEDTIKIFPMCQTVDPMQYGDDKRDVYFGDFSSSCIGTGINQYLNTVFHLYSDENIIAIEEPEIHLHNEAQRDVFAYLKEKSKEKQIILTTHSSVFVETNNTQLYLIKKSNGMADVKNIEYKEEYKSIKYELGAKNTDLFFYNAVVFIEGNTEEWAFPTVAEAKKYDFFKLGIKLINIKGNGNLKLKKIKQFLEYIKDSGVKAFVVADNEGDVQRDKDDWIKENLIDESNFHIWSKGTFVDCFSEEQVIESMKKTYTGFDMTANQLKELKEKNSKDTEKILKDHLYSKELGDLNKPALGEQLANIIEKEIRGKKARKETELEKIIEKIIQMVEDETKN